MNDPIVDEVRRIRDAHTAVFNYDLDAIFLDIKEQEQKSGLRFVTFPPRKSDESNKVLHRSGEAVVSEMASDLSPSVER